MKKFVAAALGMVLIMGIFAVLTRSTYAEETSAEETDEEETVEEVKNYFRIYYECKGGDFLEDTYVPFVYTEGDEAIIPPQPAIPGYRFEGWFTTKCYTRQIELIDSTTPKYTGLPVNEEGEPYIRLYAKWSPLSVGRIVLRNIANPETGFIEADVHYGYVLPADGIEVQTAYDDEFSKSVKTETFDTIDGTITYPKRLLGRLYKIRARAFVVDSAGEKLYSDWCRTDEIFCEYGMAEIDPTPSAGVIHSARISGNTVTVNATFENRVASDDDLYHIVKINPTTGAIIADLGSCEKDDEVNISFSLSGNLMAKLAMASKVNDGFALISGTTYIDNPEALASISKHNNPASKKGRQGTYSTEAGDKHTFHNVYLDQLIGTSGSHDVAYNYNGKTYYFYNPTHGIDYNQLIRKANADGGTVSMQLMLRWNANSNDLITPSGRTAGYNYYALNMEETAAREKIEALFMFLAEYWSKSNLHVDNWILGNEVNTYLNTTGRWYWAGNMSHDQFMNNYANTFRILYYAVKSHNSAAQVFTCCDHTWNNRDRDWGTMGFIGALNSSLRGMNPNIRWNLAYHAYTAVLTNADPWNDGAVRLYSVAHSTGASFVSPYNLEVLTKYVASNFPNTRIILSEVGFSSTGGTNPTLNGGRQSGPGVQAAATAYLYYKGHFSSNIDAVIYHTGDEHEAGKNFAIEYNESWNVYKYMDTPQYANYTNGYLGYIGGATSWESIIPGFNASALASLPNR